MGCPDTFEWKDTASVYSMDSAYRSQSSASRHGASMSDGRQPDPARDNQDRMNNQFMESNMYSPSMSSNGFGYLPEQHSDMNQIQLPQASADMDTVDGSMCFTNYSTGQNFSIFTPASVPQFTTSSATDMGCWGPADSHSYNNTFPYATYPGPAGSIDASLYANQDQVNLLFTPMSQPQRQMSKPRLDTSVRPSTIRSSSTLTHQSNDSGYNAFAMSPLSAVSTQIAPALHMDQQQHLSGMKAEKEEAPQSVNDEDEILSPSDAAEARSMEEEQGKIARSHPLYQATPDEDGKYHCPNEKKPGCNHKPTPLKCNYDKYVDSHLKPFRCHKKHCVGVQFSSTACLLRHEREAHGMHGHGSKPHLCHYADCERALPGNGFPRRYNLYDHMKRVHDYHGTSTESSPPTAQANRKSTTRKRKLSAEEGSEKRQKSKANTQLHMLQQKRAQLQQEFLSQKKTMMEVLDRLQSPGDTIDDVSLNKSITSLQAISAEFKEHFSG